MRRGRTRCGEVRGGRGKTSRDEARQKDKTGEYTAGSSRALGTHTGSLSWQRCALFSVSLSFFFPFSFRYGTAAGRARAKIREREGTRERRLACAAERERERESAREREPTTESRVGRLPVNRLLHSLLILYGRPPMLHRNSHFALSLSRAHATAGYAFALQ